MVSGITQCVIDSRRFEEKNMRKVIQEQMKFGEVAISDIEFDVRSRDEIPKLLLGLQEVYGAIRFNLVIVIRPIFIHHKTKSFLITVAFI
jgi:hypothetical protein